MPGLTSEDLSSLLLFTVVTDEWVREVHRFTSQRKRRQCYVLFRNRNDRRLTSLEELKQELGSADFLDFVEFKSAFSHDIVSNKVGANSKARKCAKRWISGSEKVDESIYKAQALAAEQKVTQKIEEPKLMEKEVKPESVKVVGSNFESTSSDSEESIDDVIEEEEADNSIEMITPLKEEEVKLSTSVPAEEVLEPEHISSQKSSETAPADVETKEEEITTKSTEPATNVTEVVSPQIIEQEDNQSEESAESEKVIDEIIDSKTEVVRDDTMNAETGDKAEHSSVTIDDVERSSVKEGNVEEDIEIIDMNETDEINQETESSESNDCNIEQNEEILDEVNAVEVPLNEAENVVQEKNDAVPLVDEVTHIEVESSETDKLVNKVAEVEVKSQDVVPETNDAVSPLDTISNVEVESSKTATGELEGNKNIVNEVVGVEVESENVVLDSNGTVPVAEEVENNESSLVEVKADQPETQKIEAEEKISELGSETEEAGIVADTKIESDNITGAKDEENSDVVTENESVIEMLKRATAQAISEDENNANISSDCLLNNDEKEVTNVSNLVNVLKSFEESSQSNTIVVDKILEDSSSDLGSLDSPMEESDEDNTVEYDAKHDSALENEKEEEITKEQNEHSSTQQVAKAEAL